MDYLLQLQLLIISFVIGIFICVLLQIKSYLTIATVSIIIFVCIELVYCCVMDKCNNGNSYLGNLMNMNPVPNSNPNTTNNVKPINTNPSLITAAQIDTKDGGMYPGVDGSVGIGFAREQDLKATKYGIFQRKAENGNMDLNAPPFDNLDPKELMTRLNYIYYATANPYEQISYTSYKTAADKQMDSDGSSLSGKDAFLQKYNAKYYPQLSSNQIDAKDCLNEGSGPNSCFQTPQLFANLQQVKEGFTDSILSQGLNNINKLFLTTEGFSNPMILDAEIRNLPVLFKNAPGNQDQILDAVSNEYIRIDDSDKLCRHCKLAVCQDDICHLQNQLFM
jgi:hypothetical protein